MLMEAAMKLLFIGELGNRSQMSKQGWVFFLVAFVLFLMKEHNTYIKEIDSL